MTDIGLQGRFRSTDIDRNYDIKGLTFDLSANFQVTVDSLGRTIGGKYSTQARVGHFGIRSSVTNSINGVSKSQIAAGFDGRLGPGRVFAGPFVNFSPHFDVGIKFQGQLEFGRTNKSVVSSSADISVSEIVDGLERGGRALFPERRGTVEPPAGRAAQREAGRLAREGRAEREASRDISLDRDVQIPDSVLPISPNDVDPDLTGPHAPFEARARNASDFENARGLAQGGGGAGNDSPFAGSSFGGSAGGGRPPAAQRGLGRRRAAWEPCRFSAGHCWIRASLCWNGAFRSLAEYGQRFV